MIFRNLVFVPRPTFFLWAASFTHFTSTESGGLEPHGSLACKPDVDGPPSVQFRLFSLCHVFSRAPLHGGPSAGRARQGPRSGLPGGQSGSPPGPGIRGAGGRARSRPAGPCLAETPATGWAGCCKVSLADYSASGLAARPGSDSQLGHNAGRAGRTPWSVLTHRRPPWHNSGP